MGKRVMCEATNPDNGDQCQCLVGHGGSHRATRMWDSPYRMTRPTNCDALVIDGGKVWRPVFGPDGMWEAANDDDWVAWEAFTDPQPFQNCTLTANDPEPPIESVVLDCEGDPWKRSSLEHEWCGVEGDDELPWRDLCYQLPPVTLLYRGEA